MFVYEFMGTAALILIGVGTSANIQLKTAKAFGTGYLMSALGWATGVFVGIVVSMAYRTPRVAFDPTLACYYAGKLGLKLVVTNLTLGQTVLLWTAPNLLDIV